VNRVEPIYDSCAPAPGPTPDFGPCRDSICLYHVITRAADVTSAGSSVNHFTTQRVDGLNNQGRFTNLVEVEIASADHLRGNVRHDVEQTTLNNQHIRARFGDELEVLALHKLLSEDGRDSLAQLCLVLIADPELPRSVSRSDRRSLLDCSKLELGRG